MLKAIVTLWLDKVGVKVFFCEMMRQTGLDFVCSSELARHLSPITLRVSGAEAAQVLDQVLGNRGCQWSRKGNIIMVTRNESQVQSYRLPKGYVTADDGESVLGA